MQAYESIGLQYFYLGKINKALYYSERMMKGRFEAKFSVIRKKYMQVYNQMMNQEKKGDENAEGKDGGKEGTKKHVRTQNRKDWINNAIVGLMDQKGIFQLASQERERQA